MKLISWNVNGLRACMEKGFMDFFMQSDADIFCLQEIKLQDGQIQLSLPGYCQYWNYAEKKGYSGTALITKKEPISVKFGMGLDEHDHEGRLITAQFDSFYIVTVYTPNAKRELERLEYRMKWEDDFKDYVCRLKEDKPVIVCGDLNVAHQPIDLKNPKSNMHNAGFTSEERGKFQALLDAGFVDTFRHCYPDKTDAYSWWSYMFQARKKNVGWRIDYFLVSEEIRGLIRDGLIYSDVFGSDHCPVGLLANL